MNPRRSAKVASALCGTVVLASWFVAWLAGFGSAGVENTAAIEDRRASSLTADAELADTEDEVDEATGVVRDRPGPARRTRLGRRSHATAIPARPVAAVTIASSDASE